MTFNVIQMQARTLSWWRDERDDVDLEPVYQRKGHVWDNKQKQYLIDSILNGFDIPKLYVADFTFLNSELNETRKKYAMIDGKQRMLAILDFFDDKVTLPRGFTYADDPKLRLAGLSYSDLVKNHPRVARKFDNSSLTIMSVITDDESKINELFVRLNSSKPLTGAELRNAMGGRLPDIIRSLISHGFFTSKIRFSTNRSQDKNLAAKLLLLEHRGTIVDTKKVQLDALVEEAREDEETAGIEHSETGLGQDVFDDIIADTESSNVDRSAKRVLSVLDRFENIFIDKDPLLVQQAEIIIVYWLVRDLELALDRLVRPFLVVFEEERKRLKASGTDDQELGEYELMARTSNDAYSIRYRTQLMQSRFEAFRSAQSAG